MADEKFYEEEGGQFQDIEAMQPLPRVPYPFPLPLPRASGLYEWRKKPILYPRPIAPSQGMVAETAQGLPAGTPTERAFETAAIYPWWFSREELRLDVDGRYPQMTASGTVIRDLRSRLEWIAQLTANGNNRWQGAIWHKDGDERSFPYTNVEITVVRSWFANQRSATITFSGGGAPNKMLTYSYKSPYFRSVEFEFDSTSDAHPVATIQTAAHPNRPATLSAEELSIETVFRRAGFNVTKSGGDGDVPKSLAGSNGTWSDMEMHDAMQVYWSRFANRAQWSMWTFFAKMHDMGNSLGGIMFDDIGPNHRQGTAIFTDSFISSAPAGDPNANAWIARMRFWTAVHEMGHTFNLAHSWQKALGTPWIPLANEPEARSFMNYPYRVSGGQSAFFADFDYRFSDGELLFMRHAPERFVQMGNADWFDHHGFQNANISAEPNFRLTIRLNRGTNIAEFLEPLNLELKLTNIGDQAQLIADNLLCSSDNLTLIIKKDGKAARQFLPFAQYCIRPANRALDSGQSVYESMLISVGRNGWDIAEPGNYTIQAALHLEGQDIVSNPLRLKIAPPLARGEEHIAQDFFSDEVGRILTFNGSHFLTSGNNILQEVIARFGDRRAAVHARIALGNALARDYKLLQMPANEQDVMVSAHAFGGKVKEVKADVKQGRKLLATALTENPDRAAETLSHIQYRRHTEMLSDWFAGHGETATAEKTLGILHSTLAARKVLKSVLDNISQHQKQITKKTKVA